MLEQGKTYELTIILSSQTEEEDLDNAKKEIQAIITKAQGKIEFKTQEKKELAYPINKQGQGIYLITQLTIPSENINNISKELKLNKKVLRHLIRQISIKPEKPKKPREIKEKVIIKKEKIEKRKQETDKTKLEEIDKKLDEIIEEI